MKPPEIDRRRKHVSKWIVDRITVRPDARSRIAGSVETALSLGKGVLHVVYPGRRRAGATLADRGSQPAFRLRPLRPELRAAHAAQFFVQQPAGLVSGLRRVGDATGRESGGAAARSEAHAGRRGCRHYGRDVKRPMFASNARGAGDTDRHAGRRAVRSAHGTRAADRHPRHRRTMDLVGEDHKTKCKRRKAEGGRRNSI